jgi:hypothetical protein
MHFLMRKKYKFLVLRLFRLTVFFQGEKSVLWLVFVFIEPRCIFCGGRGVGEQGCSLVEEGRKQWKQIWKKLEERHLAPKNETAFSLRNQGCQMVYFRSQNQKHRPFWKSSE